MAGPAFTDRTLRLVAERKIQEAIEAGKFDHLEGAGQPIEGMTQPLGHEHWLKRWAHQQRITALLTRRRDEAR